MTLVVRPVRPDDVPAVLGLVRDLAAYERAPEQVVATEDDLSAALFAPHPAVFAHVADDDGEVVGFALWFRSFSTWLGRHGLYLEDLYVRPDRRGDGVGTRLLRTLAALCVEHGYGRLEWTCLDWNEPARGFYRSLGAELQDEWTVHRLTGEPLRALAGLAGDEQAQPRG
ncbi:L-amino acid N-acyltransferase YncA [Motilibacter rhizosphaerae]|uniref:L-amino acid N-acyltransferase YncA n=1 Tax=Motilibacter rhizosphaerae TaxID=598652 RepID=A0A4V2F4Q2_9ACTN|nr:GNAT family N-acetyltransferase [Motilibacter rhizosphaerae]RZS90109.1 L-amino acid N-acyltransferase YncA [Motilibacter rhizosphaerae]